MSFWAWRPCRCARVLSFRRRPPRRSSRGDMGRAESPPPPPTSVRPPPPTSPPPERSLDVCAAARKAAARSHLSLFLLSPPSRLSHMAFLIHGVGSRPRPASSGSAPWGGQVRALGVRICPLRPRCAGERRWRRRRGLARSFGGLRCGSLAAALAAGRTPRPGRAASAWLRAGVQGLPVGLQEEDGRIPGARSPPNPSFRDRICCLHGQIRFSLTGSSRLEGGSTTP
jgi:hypothetical protein